MSNELTPEVQARIDELESGKTELTNQLATATARVKELEEAEVTDEDIQAAVEKVTNLETQVSELETERDGYKLKSDLYDKFVLKLRTDLKAAKRLSGASDDEINTFNESVDTMVDAANMSTLLDEIKGKTDNNKNFARVIAVKQNNEKQDDAMSQVDYANTMAAF